MSMCSTPSNSTPASTGGRATPPSRGWRQRLPDGFTMAVKAHRGLTHFRRLKSPEPWVERFERCWKALGDRAEALLVQLHPAMERDDARLDHFLGLMPRSIPVAMELRHPSWNDPAVFSLLERHGAAYVVMSGAGLACVPRATSDLVYIRMHGPEPASLYTGSYSEDELAPVGRPRHGLAGRGQAGRRVLQQRPRRPRRAQRAQAQGVGDPRVMPPKSGSGTLLTEMRVITLILGGTFGRHRLFGPRVSSTPENGSPPRRRTLGAARSYRPPTRAPGQRLRLRRASERTGGLLLHHAKRPLAMRDTAPRQGRLPVHGRRAEHCRRTGHGAQRRGRGDAAERDRHRAAGRRPLRRAGRTRSSRRPNPPRFCRSTER